MPFMLHIRRWQPENRQELNPLITEVNMCAKVPMMQHFMPLGKIYHFFTEQFF